MYTRVSGNPCEPFWKHSPAHSNVDLSSAPGALLTGIILTAPPRQRSSIDCDHPEVYIPASRAIDHPHDIAHLATKSLSAMSAHSRETFQLGPFVVPRLWTGLWQLSSNAWGTASASKIRQAMSRHVELGYTAFGQSERSSILYAQHSQLTFRYGTSMSTHSTSTAVDLALFRSSPQGAIKLYVKRSC